MKAEKEYHEGPEAFRRFNLAVGSILSVSRDEIQKREEAYKQKSALNPRKRGPKPKGASPVLDAARNS